MHLSKSLEIIDLGLFVRKKVLVFADFHIGFEEALNKQGVLVPRFQFKDVIQRLEKIFMKIKPEIIVVNGDIKHEFGKISDQEWREALKLADFLAKHCKRLVLTKGNHDKILGPIADKRNIELVDYFEIDSILIIHGDRIPKDISKYSTIIIGHEHPAVSIQEGGRTEKFKCFLVGQYKGKKLIVQPSFNLVTEGTDVLLDETLSPFLKQKLDDFEVYVVGDRIYYFGELKNL
ncbi:metallophosphoesterase [Candidatus Woesearchaeota archaeon]|nr:metallophosphoesterase [Candidatus Woesearchaeota archaeon]